MRNFGIGTVIVIGLIALFFLGRSCGVISKIAEPTNIISSYDEFESMYETCNQICDDISVLEQTDAEVYAGETGFSKGERLIALQNKINRWIREYNAKSRHISKSLWKSNKLPHQLSRSDFYCK